MNKRISLFAFVAVVIILLFSSTFVISEGEEGLVVKLGSLRVDSQGQPTVFMPGLHMKWPFISSVLRFDTRLQTLEVKSSRIVTAEKKDVIVDYYAKWQIADLSTFYKSTSADKSRAELLLEQQINNGLRAEIGTKTISEVVSDRQSIMSALQKAAMQSAAPLGIAVIDVRIKTIDLPPEVSSAVFERMRAERQRVASEHRAGGQAKAEAIRAKADGDATLIVAKATAEAAKLRANGDVKAAKIYTANYNRDPDFYAFYRSLLAYQDIFNDQTLMILSPDNPFFNVMNNHKK
jgi:membrane protease subunit HflC